MDVFLAGDDAVAGFRRHAIDFHRSGTRQQAVVAATAIEAMRA